MNAAGGSIIFIFCKTYQNMASSAIRNKAKHHANTYLCRCILELDQVIDKTHISAIVEFEVGDDDTTGLVLHIFLNIVL